MGDGRLRPNIEFNASFEHSIPCCVVPNIHCTAETGVSALSPQTQSSGLLLLCSRCSTMVEGGICKLSLHLGICSALCILL